MNRNDRNRLRSEILARRDALSNLELVEKSVSITSRLLSFTPLLQAKIVFVYMHFRSEVQTLDLIQNLLAEGKQVAIPYTLKEESRLLAVIVTDPASQVGRGYCGIPEPLPEMIESGLCPPEDIDLVLVPGSVFDRTGGRLGYGGGFYDRFLSLETPGALRVGLAYELQLVDQVPVEAHDQYMDFLITENQLYDCGRKRYASDSCLSG